MELIVIFSVILFVSSVDPEKLQTFCKEIIEEDED